MGESGKAQWSLLFKNGNELKHSCFLFQAFFKKNIAPLSGLSSGEGGCTGPRQKLDFINVLLVI